MALDFTGRARNMAVTTRNWLDTATLTSPTSFAAGLPLANMLDDIITKVARTTGNSLVLDMDFGRQVPVTLLAVLGHNLQGSATWRIRFANARSGAASDPGGYTFADADTVYDSRPTLASTTSTTSLSLPSPPQTVTIRVGENCFFQPGVDARAADAASPATRFMEGSVVSYNSSTRYLTLYITRVVGAGTISNWTVTRYANDITVWPSVTPFGEGGYWGEFTWGGIISVVGDDYSPPGLHMPMLYTGQTTPVYARYAKMEITDPALDYIDIGRLVVSPAYQPTLNIDLDYSIRWVDPSIKSRSRGQQVFSDVRRKWRAAQVELRYTDKNEMLSQMYELQKRVGISVPFLLIIDPTDAVNLHRQTIYGVLPDTDAIRGEPQLDGTMALTLRSEECV